MILMSLRSYHVCRLLDKGTPRFQMFLNPSHQTTMYISNAQNDYSNANCYNKFNNNDFHKIIIFVTASISMCRFSPSPTSFYIAMYTPAIIDLFLLPSLVFRIRYTPGQSF